MKTVIRSFFIVYVVTMLVYIFFGWVELQGSSVGAERYTLGQLCAFLLIAEPVYLVYLLRRKPPFDEVWRVIVLFLVVVIGTLVWGYIRDTYFRKRERN